MAPVPSTRRPPRSRSRRVRLLGLAATLATLGCLLFLVDMPIARWVKSAPFPEGLLWYFRFSERVANAQDVAALLVCLLFVDPALRATFRLRASGAPADERWAFPRIVAAAFGGGFLVQAIKSVVVRARPRAMDLTGISSALATFGDAGATMSSTRYDLGSFPSGHASVAAGVAAALSWRYPHAARLFCVLAVSAALQRVVSSAHYPSDIAFGAAIGLLVAALVLPENSC